MITDCLLCVRHCAKYLTHTKCQQIFTMHVEGKFWHYHSGSGCKPEGHWGHWSNKQKITCPRSFSRRLRELGWKSGHTASWMLSTLVILHSSTFFLLTYLSLQQLFSSGNAHSALEDWFFRICPFTENPWNVPNKDFFSFTRWYYLWPSDAKRNVLLCPNFSV